MVRLHENGPIRELFDRLADLPAPERQAILLAVREQSPELARRVAELLAHDDPNTPLQPVFTLDEPEADTHLVPRLLVEDEEIATPVGRGRVVRLLSRPEQRAIAEVYRVDMPDQGACAVKVFRPAVMSTEMRRRFRAESRALQSMKHPGIVEFLATGKVQQPGLLSLDAIITRFVEGDTLDQWAKDRSVLELTRVIAAVADAVAYLHQKAVIHRDIKPTNIIVDPHDRPVLLDLGVAKILRPHDHPDPSQLVSLGTTVAGTLRYMAPEQLTPTTRDVGTRADIYALGVLLYELITGGPMLNLSGLSEAEVFQRKQSARVAAPQGSSVRSLVLRVALKAASANPEERYGTVDRFIEDLHRAAEGRAPAVLQAGRLKRLLFLTRRHPLPTAAVVMSLLAILLGATLYVSIQQQVAAARDRAQRQFEITRKFADWAIFKQSDRLGFLPRSAPIRRDLIDEATQMLDALASDASVEDEFALDIAEAYARLAESLGLEMGEMEEALDRLNKAEVLLQRPGLQQLPFARALRVWVAFRQYDARHNDKEPPVDSPVLGNMVTELDRLEPFLPNDARLLRWRSEILYFLSREQFRAGEPHQVLRQTMDRAVTDADRAARLEPDDPLTLMQAANMRFWRGHAAIDTHDPDTSALVEDALQSALVLEQKGHPLGLWAEARARGLMCRHLAEQGDGEQFLRQSALTLDAADRAVTIDPTNKAIFRSAEVIRIQMADAAIDNDLTKKPEVRTAAADWARKAIEMFAERQRRGWSIKYEDALYPGQYRHVLETLTGTSP